MLVEINGEKNDTIQLLNNKDKPILKWTAKKVFQTVVISCPEIKKGNDRPYGNDRPPR